jgi:hypothetical protein
VPFCEVLSCQNEVTKSSKLLSQATADHYVDLLKSFKNAKPGDRAVLVNNVYQLYMMHHKPDKKSVEGGKKVVTNETFLTELMKRICVPCAITCKRGWFGFTEKVIIVYCGPTCLKLLKVLKVESFVPLQMIISDTTGSRAQMDLIDMR